MFSASNDFALVTRFVRKLRGGSQPFLAQASDGLLYVVKFIDNLQGPNLLFNECAGNELYRDFGLNVPDWRPLVLSNAFLDNNPACWMQTPEGNLRPATGLCFGSRFLGEGGKRIFEILEGNAFKRVRNRSRFSMAWLLDVCASHADNRQAIFTEDTDRTINATFIDHGHMFGGPKGDLKKHFIASRYLDPRIYERVSSEDILDFKKAVLTLDPDRLWKRIEVIPADWRQRSALDGFASCIQRLSKQWLVQNVLDTIIDAQERRLAIESGDRVGERNSSSAVLHPEVFGAGYEQGYVRHPACA